MRGHPGMRSMLLGEDREPKKPVDRDIDVVRLQDFERLYNAPKSFHVGQLVQRVDNNREHSPNNLYVVLEVITDPVVKYDPDEMATYGLRFDLRVCWFDIDGDICMIPTDSRYFQEATDVG